MKEIILHFRQYKESVKKDRNDVEVSYRLKNNGGYTVLIHKEAVGYRVATARCGKKDNFNRTVGLAIVRGRMLCDRKPLTDVFNEAGLVEYLSDLNRKCRERYDPSFFSSILRRLD